MRSVLWRQCFSERDLQPLDTVAALFLGRVQLLVDGFGKACGLTRLGRQYRAHAMLTVS